MIFWRVKELRFIADSNKTFENLPVNSFKLKKMIFDHSIGALKILQTFNFSSFHEKYSIKLRK